MILYIAAIVAILSVISLYFYVESFKPVIESNGKYFYIRVGNAYLDFKFLDSFGPKEQLLFWSTPEVVCRFGSHYQASKYLSHVEDYTSKGKYYVYPAKLR